MQDEVYRAIGRMEGSMEEIKNTMMEMRAEFRESTRATRADHEELKKQVEAHKDLVDAYRNKALGVFIGAGAIAGAAGDKIISSFTKIFS